MIHKYRVVADFVRKTSAISEHNSAKMEPQVNPYRKMLVAGVSTILLELGIDTAEGEVLETLTEMFQCCKFSKNFVLSKPLISEHIY